MSSVTSGTGLISGLPTADLIDSFMQIAAKPKQLLQQRSTVIQAERTAFMDLNARLLGLKNIASRLYESDFFRQYTAASSDSSVLTATASENAIAGSVNFSVRSLVTTHQMISSGYSDADRSPIGAGQLTIEVGNGRLNRSTALGDLNGSAGVRTGKMKITDGAGDTATIDLTSAVTVDDVIDAINRESGIDVEATVSGNHIVIADATGEGEGITIEEVGQGHLAEDLGLLQSVDGDVLTGTDILWLTDTTSLSRLNDGNGVRSNVQGEDFKITSSDGSSFVVGLSGTITDNTRLDVLNHGNGVRLGTIKITNRAGSSAIIDLSGAETIGDVRNLVNNAVDSSGQSLGVKIDAVGINGEGSLIITDSTTVPSTGAVDLKIEDVSGHAAADLGIDQETSSSSFNGTGIHSITTIGDVIRAINTAKGNTGSVTASLTANGIELSDANFGMESFTVEALSDGDGGFSMAAADLGIEGEYEPGEVIRSRDLVAGLNTVLLSSLNGGSGVEAGQVKFVARNGTETVIDFSSAQTVQDVIDLINEQSDASGVSASLNATGNGITVSDITGASSGNFRVEEVDGTTAADLGILGEVAGAELGGGNLQLQYISELTKLSDLNGGQGIREGTIAFTTTLGDVFSVKIPSTYDTLDDVISVINSTGKSYGVTASINATGDGLLITDSNEGDLALTIEDKDGGSAATDLRIEGTAAAGENTIDGSYEIRVDIDADDTLNDVAEKIRELGGGISASVINDGASYSPYRLSVTSGTTGTAGELVFDAGDTGLSMNTLVEAQDAVVLVGGEGGSSPVVMTSSTNTLSEMMPGVEINLHGTSDESVTLTVDQDIEQIVEDLANFVDTYNTIIDQIDSYTEYDQDTEEKGVLLGDSTVSTIETRLSRAMLTYFGEGSDGIRSLNSIGITFGDGGQLSFDADTFREKWADNPEAVEALFTTEETGIGHVIDGVLESLTDDTDGLLARRDKTLASQMEDLEDRVADMDILLEQRRAQYERQYASLETILAGYQDQQSALSTLASLASG